MRRKQWCLSACDKDAAAQLAESGGLDPFLALLLTARGLTDEVEAEAFLSAEIQDFDPFSLADMEKAVERIAAAMENFERIAVCVADCSTADIKSVACRRGGKSYSVY